MGNYVLVTTAESDERGPKERGRINGGFAPRQYSQHPSVVVAVDDIRAAMKKVEAAGGSVLGGSFKAGEPDDIPGIGLYAAILDPEGNRVGMLQPKMPAR